MYCTNCGSQIDDNSLFCTKCGAKVESNDTGMNNNASMNNNSNVNYDTGINNNSNMNYNTNYNTNNGYNSMGGVNIVYTNFSLGDRASLKQAAKNALRNSYKPNPYLVTLLYLLVVYVLNFLQIPIVSFLLVSIVGVGYGFWILSVARNQSNTKEFEYAINNFLPVAILGILLALILVVGYSLFIFPGVILSLGLSMSTFILRDTNCNNAVDAIKYSWQMTRGYKMDLFTLTISFIPWLLLVCITAGIAGIYVIPYMQTTFALYYEKIRQNNMQYNNPQYNNTQYNNMQ